MSQISRATRLNVTFSDGEVLTAEKLNRVISSVNSAIDQINECVDALNDGPSADVVEFFNEDYDEVYSGTVAELYFLVDDIAQGYSFKHYNSSVFAKGIGNTVTDIKWTVRVTHSENLEDGVVYPLQVTTAGSDSQIAVGDIVGYVVFKDVSKFRSQNTVGNYVTVVTETVQDIDNSPTIKNYINSNSNE